MDNVVKLDRGAGEHGGEREEQQQQAAHVCR